MTMMRVVRMPSFNVWSLTLLLVLLPFRATAVDNTTLDGTASQQQQQERRVSSTCRSGLPRSHDSRDMIRLRGRPGGRVSREYRIMTPPKYDRSKPAKVLLYFHGWGENSNSFFSDSPWQDAAQDANYVVVAPEGLGKSWQFPGSSNGYGQDESTVTTCDTNMNDPFYCYDSCPCKNRCGWTQCQDDDLDFVLELLEDIQNYICVDEERIYVAGVSNGAMLTWSMGQDKRIAARLAGMAPMIGVPHYDHDRGSASEWDLPVIGFYGDYDTVVPPGDYRNRAYFEDDSGYYWVPAHRMHTVWAKDHGCSIKKRSGVPQFTYYENDNLDGYKVQCFTHCDTGDDSGVPFSVDCRADMGHETPAWMLRKALQFFEDHRKQDGGKRRERRRTKEEIASTASSLLRAAAVAP